jgi:hypothetical protein
MSRRVFLLAALAAATPVFGQQMTCSIAAQTPAIIRNTGYTELVSDVVLNCTGGTPTAAGVPVPRYDITIAFTGTTTTSRLVGDQGHSEALLIIDEPNSPVRPARPLLNCGSTFAPDDVPGNNGPTGTAPGVCSIVSTGNWAQTYDGTNGTPNAWGTGRPNVFQGISPFTFFSWTFAGVPVDPPGNGNTRTLRFTGLRVNAPGIAAFGGTSVTATVSGSFASIPSPSTTVATLATAVLAPVNSANSGVNSIRVREGDARSFKPRNFASYYRNHPSVPGNGGDYGADLTTLYGQNVVSGTFFSEEAFNAAGRPAPPGGNPNGNPAPANGLSFASANVTGGGTFQSGAALNTALSGIVTNSGRVAFVLANIVSGYTVQVPVSVRLTQAGTSTPTGIAQLVTGNDSNGAGGTVSTNRSTSTLVNIPLTNGSATVVYEIVYAEPQVLEDLTVPVTLTRTQAAGANPTAAPAVYTGMAPFPAFPGVTRPAYDSLFPTPRFAPPLDFVALNLGPLGFETTSLPGSPAGSAYSQTVVARGGTPLYTFTLVNGSLPPGLTLNTATGVISGTPTVAGIYNFSVRVTDAAGATATQALSISITSSLTLLAPANGAASQPLRPRLSWAALAGATSYNVYLGTDSVNPASYRTGVTATFLEPEALLPSTVYYWRIEAVVPGGTQLSGIWSFTTVTDCATSLNTGPKYFLTVGGSAIINVSAPGACSWTATSDSPWLTLTSPSGAGNGSFTINVAANSGLARLGLITVGKLYFRVMQQGNPAAPLFEDVPATHPYFDYISLMYNDNITAGCSSSPFLYCPSISVSRAQMAVFIVAALNKVTGTPLIWNPTPYFNDVPSPDIYFRFVQRIRDLNITAGCSADPPLFCRNDSITHGQMAVFMIVSWMRANNLTDFTYTTTPYFTDVPSTHPFFKFIQKMKDMGFWNGCSATQYCASEPVTRGEMAPLIMRAIFGAP